MYTGVTSNLEQRVWQHKSKAFEGFTSQYNLTRLVWYEMLNDIHEAIETEKKIKAWRRSKKTELIEKMNPKWLDLAEDWYDNETHQQRIQIPQSQSSCRNDDRGAFPSE
jgi:putative endonuclease